MAHNCREGGRDIAADLAGHWRRCCQDDFAAAWQLCEDRSQRDTSGAGATQLDWRALYNHYQKSEAEKRRQVGVRLRGMWAAEAEQRSSRSIQVRLPVVQRGVG